jgi:hypothetical protein
MDSVLPDGEREGSAGGVLGMLKMYRKALRAVSLSLMLRKAGHRHHWRTGQFTVPMT